MFERRRPRRVNLLTCTRGTLQDDLIPGEQYVLSGYNWVADGKSSLKVLKLERLVGCEWSAMIAGCYFPNLDE